MTRSFSTTATALAWVSLATALTAADRPQEGPLGAFLGQPSLHMQQVFNNERFPNIVVTLKGTVLATWGTSGVRARRSTDAGVVICCILST